MGIGIGSWQRVQSVLSAQSKKLWKTALDSRSANLAPVFKHLVIFFSVMSQPNAAATVAVAFTMVVLSVQWGL